MPRPSAEELIRNPDAYLKRADLSALGFERRAIESIYRHVKSINLPGYRGNMIRVRDLLAFLAERSSR